MRCYEDKSYWVGIFSDIATYRLFHIRPDITIKEGLNINEVRSPTGCSPVTGIVDINGEQFERIYIDSQGCVLWLRRRKDNKIFAQMHCDALFQVSNSFEEFVTRLTIESEIFYKFCQVPFMEYRNYEKLMSLDEQERNYLSVFVGKI